MLFVTQWLTGFDLSQSNSLLNRTHDHKPFSKTIKTSTPSELGIYNNLSTRSLYIHLYRIEDQEVNCQIDFAG